MGYAALGLAIVGLVAGLMARLKLMLLLVGAVFLLSIGFSVRGGFGFLGTVAIIVIAQTILQGCYLLGVAIHTVLYPLPVARHESKAEAVDAAGNVIDDDEKARGFFRPFAQNILRS